MFKNLLNKAREFATPERIEALKNGAAKATEAAKYGAGVAQGFVAQTIEDRKARQQAELEAISQQAQGAGRAGEARTGIEDLHPEVQRVLQAHANIRSNMETDTRVRGASLIDLTTPQSQQLLRSKTPPGALTIGGVPIDFGDEQQHILLSGAPGTGKSVEIKKALRTIRQRKQKAVVYDPSGEFTSMFYRPGCDVLLNPLDERNAKWNPWADAEAFEYAAIAKSLIPDRGESADPFWSESARAVIETLLLECNSLDDMIYTGLSAPISDLAQLVQQAGFSGMIGPEKTFQSTRATLSVYLRSLAMLDNVERDDANAFSFRHWLNTDDTDDSWVFLPVPARARDAVRPVVSMLLDTAVRHIMSLRPDPDRRIWLVIDELPSLQNIPSIHPALAEGRKYGIGGILGVQTFHQLKKTFGDAGAAALWGLPKTRLYLRIGDAETGEMVSKEVGEVQLKRKTTSTSSSESVSNSKGGGSDSTSESTSESEQTVTERLVLPAEIMGLPDMVGYLRTGGSHRVAKVTVEFDGLPRRGEQDDFVWRAQRQLPKGKVEVVHEKKGGVIMEEKVQGAVVGLVPTKNVEANENSGLGEVGAIEVDEVKIRGRALELMRESMGTWDDQSVAALTDAEITELTGVFIERAEIEITGQCHAAISTQ